MLLCSSCRFPIREEDGIWRTLASERLAHFDAFRRDYEAVRQAEGRGSQDAAYYLALPFRDVTGKLDWQWRIRATSYRSVERHIWASIEQRCPHGFDLLDVGAGNGWLSYRVALRGHRPVAVDLIVNDQDGLGAARHYSQRLPGLFPRFQAEMDRLPFTDAQFDVVLFNAAFHYSVDYAVTLREALRVLRPQGHMLILDSPVYRQKESGLAMVREKHKQFETTYGFRSDSVPSCEFLTFDQLDELAAQLDLRWKILHPWYGFIWALRPMKAKLQGKREPSKFVILWGRRRALPRGS